MNIEDLTKKMEAFMKQVQKETKALKKQLKKTKTEKADIGSLDEAENMMNTIKKFEKQVNLSKKKIEES